MHAMEMSLHSFLVIVHIGTYIPYLLDQTSLSISRRSRIEATPPDALKEIMAALE